MSSYFRCGADGMLMVAEWPGGSMLIHTAPRLLLGTCKQILKAPRGG